MKPSYKLPVRLPSHPEIFTLIAMLSLFSVWSASAGTFFSDFNSGVPANSAVYGNATIGTTGGFTNSGCLKLTTAAASQNGGFVITNDIDAGTPVVSFTANFKALVGGGNAADGFSFNFAPDVPLGTITEEGAGTGLTVEFDTFLNGGSDTVGIDVKAGGVEVATLNLAPTDLRANTFVDVFIQLASDGTLNVYYDGIYAHTNLSTAITTTTGGLFGFGSRTGGQNDNHFIDNLSIVTQTNALPLPTYYFPIGRTVRGDAPIKIVLTDFGTAVAPGSISLKVDGVTVTPSVTQSTPLTTITYTNPVLFASNSSHTVSLVYNDNATPTANTNTLQYSFTVASYAVLASSLAAPPSYVNLASPGLDIRYSQIADSGSRDIARAEAQLANLLIDSSTGLPFQNLANPNPNDSSFTFVETNVVNYAFPSGGAVGDFPSDTDIPGIPGPTTGNGYNYAMGALTYLHLSPGLYSLGVNSSDGFKLTVADSPDVFAFQESIFNGVRGAADTTVSFFVAVDGYYPFRLVYFTGDPTYNPAPGTINPTVEFFNIDSGGNKILINNTNVVGYVSAFRAAKTKPYIRSISPAPGETGVPGNSVVNIALVDQSLTVQTNTIQMLFNGTIVSPVIVKSAGVTTLSYDPPGDLTPNSTNTVQLAFTDGDTNRRTNSWQFFAANIFQEIWTIAPGSQPYVTTSGNERGLAYNPKTDHLLLVSRSVGGLEIEILNSSTGAKIGTLDKTGIAGGTFVLNQIDVADDGVIYAANLATDTAVNNIRIYRWANETAAPQLVYSDNPANPGNAGTPLYGMRVGDVMVVRRSGAGTQILMGQGAAINVAGNPDIGGGTNAILFTTTDGTNFSAKRIPISGIAGGDIRLGIAFGCGDTFYGKQTGSNLRYANFNPITGTGALINSYSVNNPISTATVGPIGFDVADQRLIGNATSANAVQHSMNLYDAVSLVIAPTANNPLDTRVFHTANTAFGTGAVDFTPDGSRVFALDTANGIIAFSLTAKPAAISICSPPQNFIAPLGNIGFFGVTALGSQQKYQWRFNGVKIAGATNPTLDTYYIAQTNLGFYSVVVTNSFGSVTSSVAILDTPITITNQPASQVVAVGGTATFTVGVTNGLPAYGYQWQLNGSNITGATASTYSTNNAQVANAGSYTVVVSDSLGQTVTSAAAILTVGNLGTGTGLNGDYYTTQLQTYTNFPTLTRIDATVNFDFGVGSPDPLISTDSFTVRWSGQVQPIYSQTYTFYTITDDGVRLWVNGQLVINSFINQGATERNGSISLVANQKYDLLMEYFENTGAAVAKLSWSSPAQVKQIIPQSQLYPGVSPVIPRLSSTIVGTNLILNWSGSFQLQTSTNVLGPYIPVGGSVGPYTNNVTADQQRYFRLLNQD